MNSDCISKVLEEEVENVQNTLEHFSIRASQFTKIATINALHGDFDRASELIHSAASNLMTHGEHKDILLFHVLEIIQSCSQFCPSESKEWIKEIIPLVAAVTEYTDGDETGHLAILLAETVAEVCPEALPKYYMCLCQDEQYRDALEVFHIFLKSVDLSGVVAQAIARSAIDDTSLSILNERAETGDLNAQSIYNTSCQFLGGIKPLSPSEQEESSPSLSIEKRGVCEPSDYPPEQLGEYVTASIADDKYYSGHYVSRWMDYWTAMDRRDDVFSAIVKEEEKHRFFDSNTYDRIYNLARGLFGKDDAYIWLVKAHIECWGWDSYHTSEENAIKHWKIIKNDYPDKWFEFLTDTMKSKYSEDFDFSVHSRIVRLVKYCIFMGQLDTAKDISEQVVDSAIELVSPISLDEPQWIYTRPE